VIGVGSYKFFCTFALGKSYTTSSLRILQGGNAAKV